MKRAFWGLLGLGLLQMAGDALGIAPLRRIGAATGASPAPRMFSAVRGLETYSARFFVEWTDAGGQPHSLRITPELSQRLRGPYNRRNVYGAVLACAPVLHSDPALRPMFDSVARYALCGDAPLLGELGIEPGARSSRVSVRLEPRAGAMAPELPLVLEAPCP